MPFYGMPFFCNHATFPRTPALPPAQCITITACRAFHTPRPRAPPAMHQPGFSCNTRPSPGCRWSFCFSRRCLYHYQRRPQESRSREEDQVSAAICFALLDIAVKMQRKPAVVRALALNPLTHLIPTQLSEVESGSPRSFGKPNHASVKKKHGRDTCVSRWYRDAALPRLFACAFASHTTPQVNTTQHALVSAVGISLNLSKNSWKGSQAGLKNRQS
jgi:hypothetical protein